MTCGVSPQTTNSWPRPITVFGYDDTFAVAGDLFEAETTCVKEHNMGQVSILTHSMNVHN